jgi:hypothetical protein
MPVIATVVVALLLVGVGFAAERIGSSSRRSRPPQPIVDRFAEPGPRHRHDRDGRGTAGIERAQVGKKPGRCLDQIAALRQVQRQGRVIGAFDLGWSEGEQRLTRLDALRIEAQPRARGVVRGERPGRNQRRIFIGQVYSGQVYSGQV